MQSAKSKEILLVLLAFGSLGAEGGLWRTLRKVRRCTSRQLLVAASVAIICNKGRPYRLIIVFVDRNNSYCVTLLRYVSAVQHLHLCGLWAKETTVNTHVCLYTEIGTCLQGKLSCTHDMNMLT